MSVTAQPSMRPLNLLILTATISPPQNAVNLTRSDPRLRLDDYKEAFRFYLAQLQEAVIDRIVFVDNSASDTSEIAAMVPEALRSKVEVFSFHGLDHAPELGRGFGEFKLIAHAMAHSPAIQALGEQDTIWKVTGRYILRNLAEIVRARPAGTDFYCNCRNWPMRWVDLHTLAWTRKGYRNFLDGIHLKIGEAPGVSSEQLFRREVDAFTAEPGVLRKRFNRIFVLEGVRGFDSQRYEESPWKSRIRQVCLRVIPWVWI